MRKLLIAACVLLMWPASASADCRQFEDVVERSTKALSGSYVGVDGLQSILAIQTIQVNLTLMAANGCKLPGRPISAQNYMDAAFACMLDRQKANDGRPPESCNSDNWKLDK